MSRPGPAPRRRGIMLMEIVVALAFVGLFLLIFQPLWNATWRVQKEAPAATEAIFHAEAAAARLRADAWAADAAALPADGGLELGGSATVRWSIRPEDDATALVRTTADAEEVFRLDAPATAATADAPPAFEVAPGRVVVSIAGRRILCPAPLTEARR